jgi:hypothetical protein
VVIGVAVLLVGIILATIVFYYMVLKPKYDRMNAALRQGFGPILKPELDAEEAALHEVDGEALMKPGIRGWQAEICEMPAVEEVASEIGDSEQSHRSFVTEV